jgi:imidazole glycerol-phosphate synthase subunit HisH
LERDLVGKTIAIINYGMGNIGSVANAIGRLGAKYIVSGNREDLSRCDAFILPGVGAFPAAMKNLRKLDLLTELTEQVMIKKKPILGICLGMQLLAEDSVEQEFCLGFGWMKGHVRALDASKGHRIPHVGWNNIEILEKEPLFSRIDREAQFYFDHCFHLSCNGDGIAASCEYGSTFVAAIHQENIFATQFHPEKSQRSGLKVLRNFLNFVNFYQ